MALPVLTFHALDERASVISCRPRVFREGLARLRARGHRAIRLEEAVACLRERRPLPSRAFVLTFDDGFQSVYAEAFPALREHGLTATVFLTVGAGDGAGDRRPAFEGRTMLSWPEIREMQAAGIEFGAHTLTHADLTRLSAPEIEAEMSGSKARIEAALGAPVASFAYPFGRYDRRSRELAERHFSCACTDTLGLVTARSDPYALARVDAYYLRTPRRFALMTTRAFPWYLRARNLPRRLRRALTAPTRA